MAGRRNGIMNARLFARVERLFDVEAFEDLCVLIAGCGSGGGQVALQLAMSGVRKFILVDRDNLEVENVIRHVCGIRHLGWRKTAALADVLRDRNPQVEVQEFDGDLMRWPEIDRAGRARERCSRGDGQRTEPASAERGLRGDGNPVHRWSRFYARNRG